MSAGYQWGRFFLALRLARRELRGGLTGFRVFLACLALGVAAISGVGSVSEAMMAGLRADGRVLLGGDLDLRLRNFDRAADSFRIAVSANPSAPALIASVRCRRQVATATKHVLRHGALLGPPTSSRLLLF